MTLQIVLDDTTPAGLKAFRTANQKTARELVATSKTLIASVVLNQPLSVSEFNKLVDKYGLQVNGFQLRVIDGRGDRVTLFGAPTDGQLVPMQQLQSMLEWVQKQTGTAKLLGITSIDIGLPSANYESLSADPSVFLVDLTPAFAEQHLRQQYASLLKSDDAITTSAYPIYWYLESSQLVQP